MYSAVEMYRMVSLPLSLSLPLLISGDSFGKVTRYVRIDPFH